MPVLNVKPQSVDGGPTRPPQRRKVSLDDHHQTWLANYNEIRAEVNHSTSYNIPRTIVYRNEYGAFAANSISTNRMIFGTDDPYASPTDSPITMNGSEFILSPAVTMTVNGPANFSNEVNFTPNSVVNVEGTFNANGPSNFNDMVNFYALTHFHPSSTLLVDGPSFFNEDITINADMNMTGDIGLTGDIVQTGNTVIDGNLDIGDDLIVRGNLTVLGEHTTLEVTELVVEDKNIVINKNDVYTPLDAGIFIQKGTLEKAGYFKVHDQRDDLLQFKAPTGYTMTLDITEKDVYFRLYDDFAADQELLTTSDVAFRSVLVDPSFGRHNDVPSYTQQHDPIAKDKGWVSTPWVYTNAVEATDNLIDANTTGLYMGSGTFSIRDEIALVTKGQPKVFLDYFGNIGFGTKYPISDMQLYTTNPTFTITTDDYKSKGMISFTDFAERVDDAGMYLMFDANTGSGLLELSTQGFNTEFSISVGGYQKNPEITIFDNLVSINEDLRVLGDTYVRDELIVDETLYVRDHKVGINVVTPNQALDVSGNIQGNSDLILNGLEPFALIGTVTALEPMGRSGIAIEEQSPLVQMSTTEEDYRHGSILYFNDAIHDSNWVIGTSRNGDKLDIGKSFGRSANTPEYGLDEYHGETLMRFTEEDRAEMYLEADNSNAGLILNTRTNGIQLYLGEQNNVLVDPRSTLSYSPNTFSSVIQWHGGSSNNSIGELTYFPNGNDDYEFGSFRFSRTNGIVNQDVPSAKVGANQFYANDKIAVSQTAPTAELHITKDYSEALIETEDRDTLIRMSVSDAKEESIIRGEHTSGESYFNFRAQNPASAELSSGVFKIFESVDKNPQEIIVSLTETITPSSYTIKTIPGENDVTVARPSLNYNLNLNDNNTVIYEQFTSATLDSKFEINGNDETITELNTSNNLDTYFILDEVGKKIKYQNNVHSVHDITTITNTDINYYAELSNDKTYELEINGAESNLNITRENSIFNLNLFNDTTTLKMESSAGQDAYGNLNTPTELELKIIPDGNSSIMFSGAKHTFLHETHPLYNAYHDYIDFMVPVNFYDDVLIEGDLTANNGIIFPASNPNNKIEFNLTPQEGLDDDASSPITNFIKWTCNTDAAQIYLASTGDLGTRVWGDTAETVDTSRLIFEMSDNQYEGFEFKHKGTNGIIKEIFFIESRHVLTNVPIRQTHHDTLIEYQAAENKWLLKDENSDDGLYWNLNSSGLYSFSSSTELAEYTDPEDVRNQYVFVQNGVARASIDLDTGSIRAAGDVVANNDVIGFVTSDRKYKDNIINIENALEKVDKIRGVEFDWKKNPSGYTGHDIGVVAQEIEEIVPEAVRIGGNGQLQVNYEKLVPLLIQCVKELKDEINILKKTK